MVLRMVMREEKLCMREEKKEGFLVEGRMYRRTEA